MGKILVIDDETYIGWVIKKAFESTENEVTLCLDGKAGLEELEKQSFDVVFLDLRLPDYDGMELLVEIRKQQKDLVVIIITAHGSIDSAIACMKLGAFDYITKPFDVDELILQADKAMELNKLKGELIYLKGELGKDFQDIRFDSRSARVSELLKSLEQVAKTNATVLITGESGTGKKTLGRRVHQLSARANKPFVVYNCGIDSDENLEAELFGVETSVFSKKLGKLELAQQGTLFIDDVDKLSLNAQGKLIRILDQKEFQRVGGNTNLKLEARIIASTSKNLIQAVAATEFREDLYYRLAVVPMELSPLRERREDIEDLIDYFIKKYDVGNKIKQILPEAMKLLKNYHWPGNIRELENAIERIVILSGESLIGSNSLPLEIFEQRKNNKEPIIYFPEEGINLENVERELIIKALKLSAQNQSRAAQLLSITRSALIYRMQKYNIN